MFREHPQSVGESYFEHMGVALTFSVRLFAASLACAVHGLIPGLFCSTGSRQVAVLHERMVVARRRRAAASSHVAA